MEKLATKISLVKTHRKKPPGKSPRKTRWIELWEKALRKSTGQISGKMLGKTQEEPLGKTSQKILPGKTLGKIIGKIPAKSLEKLRKNSSKIQGGK